MTKLRCIVERITYQNSVMKVNVKVYNGSVVLVDN